MVDAYIEITPFDMVKYEVDKTTGYLRVDRPQRTSSQPPTLYGFIPRTLCGERVNALSTLAAHADQDPLDICIVSERPINRSDIVLSAQVVGGLRMVDGGEADDKIIAVLENDPFWGDATTLKDLPASLVERLTHYFSTYKLVPGAERKVLVETTYDAEFAHRVITAAMADYADQFGE
jgi:inorganic pyrophosphatase